MPEPTGVDMASTGGMTAGMEPAPAPTISPQIPGSDTQLPPTGDEPVDAGVLSPQQVQALEQQLREQRSIQAGLDRTNTQLQRQLQSSSERAKELETQLEQYRTASTGNDSAISLLEEQIAGQQQELVSWKQQAEQALDEARKLKMVAGEFPHLSYLIQADALPSASNDDEMRQKLGIISDAHGERARQDYLQAQAGARPPASPPAGAQVSSSFEDLNEQRRAAIAANDEEKIKEVNRQWYELAEVSELPSGRPEAF